MGGVYAGEGPEKRWIQVKHVGDGIVLVINHESAAMSPAAARSLARQLYRMARRFEAMK